jgi:hypothetical protein
MVTTLELQSPLPPPAVLDRIRADAEDWHESRLSPAARQRNLYGFALRVRGHRFSLRVRGGRQNAFAPVCEGEVHDSRPGSRIVARFRLPYLTVIAGILWVSAVMAAVLIAPRSRAVDGPGEGVLAALFMAIAAALLLSLAYAAMRYVRREAHIWHDEIAALLRRASSVEGPSAAPQN